MGRIELLKSRDGLSDKQQAVFDWVVESRGKMLRPYEVLLHVPGLAQPAAELGHQIRYEGQLSGHDRELAIITAAKVLDCAFEWDSHVGLAREQGVSESAIEFLQSGAGELTEAEEVVVGFVRELGQNNDVSDARFARTEQALGGSAPVVELSALVGYYTFLGYVMKVGGAC
ncbi:MAG: AhpD family alkylhydroperoxidase [Verrucomicrobiales bacterium]|jgi:AhpD family alkylhydroperoxidase